MATGKIIKKLRQENKITLQKLEELTGVKYPQIIRYEKGQAEPRADTLINIVVKGFDIPYSKALDLINEFKISQAKENLSKEKEEEIFGKSIIENIGTADFMLPVFSSIGAGYGKQDDQVIDYMPISEDLQRKKDRLFYAKVSGDSMFPTINHGDLVLIDKTQREIVNDKVYAAYYDLDDATIKRVRKEDGKLLLIPDNEIYEARTVTEENDQFKLIGRVISVVRNLD